MNTKTLGFLILLVPVLVFGAIFTMVHSTNTAHADACSDAAYRQYQENKNWCINQGLPAAGCEAWAFEIFKVDLDICLGEMN